MRTAGVAVLCIRRVVDVPAFGVGAGVGHEDGGVFLGIALKVVVEVDQAVAGAADVGGVGRLLAGS